ncbi:hypothetical protein F4780DRAFT_718219 [Xylariomycetidae sp. FL0641]|nr:hypothetical protein F4780DRAFT_718219 [Xylariomycetidae sp. FL0641]
MKHGETAKTLASIREEYTQLRTTVNTSKAEAESAKALLLQNESSWEERRQKFEQELSELRARRDDANAQNKLLHEQLENVTAQVTALQQTRASTGESLESIAAQPSGSDADRFRELSNYLRREKDILEVQYDLKVQEARRLQTQLEYTQSQLDDSRLKLEQERQSQGDRDRSTMAQKDLMKTIEELNVYRESSATLRTQAQQAQARLTEKTAKITELEATIQPLEAQIEELQSQQSFKEAELKQLQEDRDRWQKRTEDILSKHGRTDPAELEELKQTVKNLEAERDTLREAEGSLKAKISELEASQADQQAKWNETKDRLINSAKERSRVLTAAKNGVIAEKDQLQAKLDEANGELATMKQTIQDSESAKLSAQEEAASFKRQVESMREEARNHVAPPQEPAPTGTTNADSVNSEALSALQTQLTNARAELESVTAQKASLEEELQTVRTQLETAVTEKDQALSNTQTQRTNEDSSMENGVQQHEDKPANTLSDDERRALEEKVAAAEAKSAELEAKIKELQDNHDSIIKSRSDKMKDALNKRLNEAKANIESERAQMKADKEKLEADFNLRMEQERKIWEAEHGGKPAEGQAPQTPQQPKTETPAATPTTAAIPNLTGMSDQEVRDMVTTNPTLMGIVANNVKNKLAVERKKMREEQEAAMKAEIDQKVAQAKQSQTELIEKKAHLKLNMTENRVRAANAKLGVVETAAKETPQRPVVEVWEVAKDAKPPPAPKPPGPAPTAAPAAASGTNNTTAPASQPAPSAQASAKPTGQEQKSAPATGLPQPGVKSSLPNHPFTGAQQPPPTQQPAANSFAQSGQQQSQIPKASGLPRKASGPGVPARGGGRGGRGGRGGAQGRASLDPSADNFQPGAKRPRGDSEAGNGPKRARGGGPQ